MNFYLYSCLVCIQVLNKYNIQFYEINAEEAEMAFLAAKSALENASDEKRKIEINSQFKKARARLVCFNSIV